MPKEVWTPEIVTELKHMHGNGLTLQAIADILGFTRNMVAGACHRHKLKRIDMEARKAKTSSEGSGRRKKGGFNISQRSAKLLPDRIKPVSVTIKWVDTPQPIPRGLDIMQLTEHTCKWSISDTKPHLFCGAATTGNTPWCPHHYGRVYD
jgi:hypothetical protein